jgi:hypothetical protein
MLPTRIYVLSLGQDIWGSFFLIVKDDSTSPDFAENTGRKKVGARSGMLSNVSRNAETTRSAPLNHIDESPHILKPHHILLLSILQRFIATCSLRSMNKKLNASRWKSKLRREDVEENLRSAFGESIHVKITRSLNHTRS